MTDKAFNLKLIVGGDEPACVEVTTEAGALWARVYAPNEAEAVYRAQMMLSGYNCIQEPASYQTALLAHSFDRAMGRLEDMMMGDDGQAWSETERAMPSLREVRETHPDMLRLRELERSA